MKIVDERKSKATEFKKVSIGQVFCVDDGLEYGDGPYMKIPEIEDIDDNYYNAVALQNGTLVYLNNNKPITLYNATLNIY